jgi:putative flippase GtrA
VKAVAGATLVSACGRRRSVFAARQIITFSISGFASVAVYLFFFAWLIWLWPDRIWVTSAMAYLVSMFANYLMQRRITFRSSRPHREAVTRYLVVHAVAAGINSTSLEVFVRWLSLQIWIAQAIAIGCVAVWSFGAQKFWVFADNVEAACNRERT